jgi:antitoxin component YwqK of YwqJK toxin-antitoxin module
MKSAPLFVVLVSLPLLLGGCGEKSKEVNQDELEEREGIIYLKGSDTLYTGKAYELYENGVKKGEVNFKDGKIDGLGSQWYENGVKKQSEVNYKDGRLNGLVTGWHENGQKKGEVTYKDGEMISAKWWNSKGEPVDSREEANKE